MKIINFIQIFIIVMAASACGYFNAYNFVIERSEVWTSLKQSNEKTSQFLSELNETIKTTDWCGQ